MTPPDPTERAAPHGAFRLAQDRLASLLGCDPQDRPGVVHEMLHRSPKEATGYWLQLVVAAGIATLGLVLGSTAVVIGAMLVAPLMTPIVSLGMGLAVGSPFLVLRGTLRVMLSIVVVVGFSAGLTRSLPFHEVNAEITARTTPTALDLATAMFCALAGVYAAMRPSSDVATTAAGTSIGISLVPPLCVSGFGVGTASSAIAKGASLLFLTNFAAIVLVGTLSFALAGFAHVDVRRLEEEELKAMGDAGGSRVVVRRLARIFRSRGGPWLRVLMPLALLAALYSPLRSGLDEVAWQIRARAEVQEAVAALPRRVVESRVRVERGQIHLVIFLLGGEHDARLARESLAAHILRKTGVAPRLEVYAVPDSVEFEAFERAIEKRVAAPPVAVATPEAEQESFGDELAALHARAQAAVEARWPRRSAGEPLLVELDVGPSGIAVAVTYLGAPLDDAARETLQSALSTDLAAKVAVVDEAVPTEPVVMAPEDDAAIAHALRAIDRARGLEGVSICVTEPDAAVLRGLSPAKRAGAERTAAVLRKVTAGHPRTSRSQGSSSSVRFVEGACDESAEN